MNAESNTSDQAKRPAKHAKRQGLNHALDAITKQYGETLARPTVDSPGPKAKIPEAKPNARRFDKFHHS